jgi:hypothetical protein
VGRQALDLRAGRCMRRAVAAGRMRRRRAGQINARWTRAPGQPDANPGGDRTHLVACVIQHVDRALCGAQRENFFRQTQAGGLAALQDGLDIPAQALVFELRLQLVVWIVHHGRGSKNLPRVRPRRWLPACAPKHACGTHFAGCAVERWPRRPRSAAGEGVSPLPSAGGRRVHRPPMHAWQVQQGWRGWLQDCRAHASPPWGRLLLLPGAGRHQVAPAAAPSPPLPGPPPATPSGTFGPRYLPGHESNTGYRGTASSLSPISGTVSPGLLRFAGRWRLQARCLCCALHPAAQWVLLRAQPQGASEHPAKERQRLLHPSGGVLGVGAGQAVGRAAPTPHMRTDRLRVSTSSLQPSTHALAARESPPHRQRGGALP